MVQNNGRANLALLAISHGVNHVYQLLPPIVIPKIAAEFSLSNLMSGALLACFIVSYSLLPLLSGFFAKNFSRRFLLSIGFAISALSFLTIGLMDNILLFAPFLFLAGAGGSTYHPNGIPFLAETYSTNRGRSLGFHQTGGALGSFVAPILAGLLVVTFDWRITLMVLAVPGLILSLILWLRIVKPIPVTNMIPQGSEKGFRNFKVYGSSMLFIIAAFIYVLGARGVDAFANVYFVNERGISNFLEASLLFSSLKIAGFFSAPLCGKLSDIFGRKKILFILIILESISLYSITVAPTGFLAVPCIFFGFAAFGLLAVGEALLADITPLDQYSTIFGINFAISFTGSIILSPVLGGFADVYSFSAGFIILSALMPLSIPLLAKVRSKPVDSGKSQFQ